MTKVSIFIIIFAVLAAVIVVGFFYISKPTPESPVLPPESVSLEKLNTTVPAPVEEAVPKTNPFEEAKTNPFRDIKTNPFD